MILINFSEILLSNEISIDNDDVNDTIAIINEELDGALLSAIVKDISSSTSNDTLAPNIIAERLIGANTAIEYIHKFLSGDFEY